MEKIKVFQTKSGVELFFDEETYSYETENISEVKEALYKDLENFEVDPQAAAVAHNILTIMSDMDRQKGKFPTTLN